MTIGRGAASVPVLRGTRPRLIDLVTGGAGSTVNLISGAQSRNVFGQVGNSATFGANSTLRGDVLAFTSITVGAGLVVAGWTMAINGTVALGTDTVSYWSGR